MLIFYYHVHKECNKLSSPKFTATVLEIRIVTKTRKLLYRIRDQSVVLLLMPSRVRVSSLHSELITNILIDPRYLLFSILVASTSTITFSTDV